MCVAIRIRNNSQYKFFSQLVAENIKKIGGESCLILGYSKGRAVHIVCGYTNIRTLRIITVYLPKPPKWIDEKTRRERGKHYA